MRESNLPLEDKLDIFEYGLKAQELFADSRIQQNKEIEEAVKARIRRELEEVVSRIDRMQFEECPPKLLVKTIKTQLKTTINIFL